MSEGLIEDTTKLLRNCENGKDLTVALLQYDQTVGQHTLWGRAWST